jgi:serine/threonine protein phosphatase 1
MLYQKIAKPMNGTRWVIGDIHGCAQTFKTLVNKLALTPQDQLFLLGDYIDRGPDSAGVLDFIFELEDNHLQIYPLRGNHEQDLLENWHFFGNLKTVKNLETFIEACQINQTLNLLDERNNLKTIYYQFIKNLPFYYDLGDYYLVHAGFDFTKSLPLIEYEDMLWIRGFSAQVLNYTQTRNRRIVVGHSVHQLTDIQAFIEQKNIVIPLDNGCYYGLYNPPEIYQNQYAHLCAFNLDTWELVSQLCVD